MNRFLLTKIFCFTERDSEAAKLSELLNEEPEETFILQECRLDLSEVSCYYRDPEERGVSLFFHGVEAAIIIAEDFEVFDERFMSCHTGVETYEGVQDNAG